MDSLQTEYKLESWNKILKEDDNRILINELSTWQDPKEVHDFIEANNTRAKKFFFQKINL